MKKVLAVSAFAVLGVVALSSCKKDYTCSWTINGTEYSQTYPDMDKTSADAQEVNCKNVNGTWAVK